jgi:predicted 2-oxoglutarate/Fe(II)-dependent dioxygenase YbiX
MLLDEVENMKLYFNFEPNPEEDELRQIPEIVLEEFAPDIFLSMMSVVYSVMNPIFMVLWQRYIETSYSIQVANYNIKEKQQGAWHHDQTSDISVVVPLNTGDYKGGGTEFMGRGVVEPLPNGHALIFPSFTHMHRGLAVDEGDRYLLVFWLKTAIPI